MPVAQLFLTSLHLHLQGRASGAQLDNSSLAGVKRRYPYHYMAASSPGVFSSLPCHSPFLRHFQLMADPAANMLVEKASLQSFVNGVVTHSYIFPIADVGGGSTCSPHSHRSSIKSFLSHPVTVTSHRSPVPSHRSLASGPGRPHSESGQL